MTEAEQESHPTKPDSGDESEEDESEVLEESPCGRWQKRREEVEQRDVPGIDNAFLAMDTEEGVEVVWNEVQFSEKKNFKAQQDKIRQVFDNLIQLEHPNIVKFHKYWTDTKGDKPRVIFITEYMSSGSLKQFMKKTKKNNRQFPLRSWKRWCTQILSALSYLHSCSPPIIHGNLTTDTIFIQHNGLIKIGSVAPDAIHLHVKTYRDDMRNMHCIAPDPDPITTKVDIFSFGMCALEMAALGFQGNGEGGKHVTPESIQCTLDSLDNMLLKNFLIKCIEKDPAKRPTARELLFDAVLFEVHSLRLLAAHTYAKATSNGPSTITEEACFAKTDPNKVVAEIFHPNVQDAFQIRFSQVPAIELEKFLEDVRNGVYPLTAFAMPRPPPSRPQAKTPELAESVKSETPEHMDVETRMVINMSCQMKKCDDSQNKQLSILLRMDDKMNRQLQCELSGEDNSSILADELVHYGFINELDRDKVALMIEDYLRNGMISESPSPPIAIPSS